MGRTESKSLVQRYFDEVVSQGNLDLIDELFAPPIVDATRINVMRIRNAFPDVHVAIRDQIAEADKVATLWILSGTHQGVWESPIGAIAPSGQRISYTGTTCLRISAGQIVEVLGTNHDHLGLLQQLGALPAFAPRPGA